MRRILLKTWAAALLLALSFALLPVSCAETDAETENGASPGESRDNDAAGYMPDNDIITRPPAGLEDYAEEQEFDLVVLSGGALRAFDPASGESKSLAVLPSGYSPVSGPVCSPGGERIYCAVRDHQDAVWIACYQAVYARWEIRFLQGATDWDGWTDGYLPSPEGAGMTWWRNYWDTGGGIRAEMFHTDLEEMITEKTAVFYEDMIYPLGWCSQGRLLVCQAFTPRAVAAGPAGLYLFEPGGRTREIERLAEQLHHPWLELLEIDVKHGNEKTVELFYLGWNPYHDDDIWLTEVSYEYAFGDEAAVALKRVRRDGSGYRDLNLRMDLGNIWRLDWHPAVPGFTAYTNDRPFPTESYSLYLVDLETFQKRLIGDTVQGACWRKLD